MNLFTSCKKINDIEIDKSHDDIMGYGVKKLKKIMLTRVKRL